MNEKGGIRLLPRVLTERKNFINESSTFLEIKRFIRERERKRIKKGDEICKRNVY